jgi:hypothetical protein
MLVPRRCVAWTLFVFAAVAFGQEPSMAELRQQLVRIDLTKASDMADYIRRVRAVAGILPSLEKAYQKADQHFAEGRKKYRNRPDMLRLIAAIEKLNGFDRQGLAVLKQEVGRARWLAELPADKQQRYFDEKIMPLRRKMIEIGKAEVEFARQMKAQGLALPTDVAESLK